MSYQPDEAVTLRALQVRAASRDNQYKSLMELTRRGLESTADNFGVAHAGLSAHDLACRIVDVLYPDAQAPVQSGDPNTIQAQMATAADRQRYAYMTGSLNDEAEPIGNWLGDPDDESVASWPIDVPERMAGVGYKRADGTICPLDSDGSVMLSGWGPEKVRFLLVSLAPFFEADYIKQFAIDLYMAAAADNSRSMVDKIVAFLNEQNWLDDASEAYLDEHPVAAQPSAEPIYDKTATDTGNWSHDKLTEYPTVGTGEGDAPTEIINTGEINQYKPGPY